MKKLEWIPVALAFGLTLAGCSVARLRAKAALDFKCDPAAVRSEAIEGWADAEKAFGCGRTNWYVYDGARWISPSDRASVELSCPMEELTVTALDKTTISVRGCDGKAVYVLVDGIGGPKWVLRSTDSPLSRR
jgi:hypothetical protein